MASRRRTRLLARPIGRLRRGGSAPGTCPAQTGLLFRAVPVDLIAFVEAFPDPQVNVAAVAREGSSGTFLDELVKFLDDDFECVMHFPGMKDVTYRGGPDALRRAYVDRVKALVSYRQEFLGIIDAGDVVVVFHRGYIQRASSDVENVVEVGSIWTVGDQCITKAERSLPANDARAIAYTAAANAYNESARENAQSG